jgi:IclR family pca regulon transcriptional regulator
MAQTRQAWSEHALERLAAEQRESSAISVSHGDEIVYVGRVPTCRIMRVAINVGTRFPAYATSMGRVLLAGLPEPDLTAYLARAEIRPLTPRAIDNADALAAELTKVRDQGWALVDQELEEGLRSIAAPVRDASGRTIAAVNVSAHASRVSAHDVQETLLPPLLETAQRIEADLARAYNHR